MPDSSKLKALQPEQLDDIELVLRFFHIEAKQRLQTLGSFQKAQFLGNIDSTVVDAIFFCSRTAKTDERRQALCNHVKPLLRRLQNAWPDMDQHKLPEFCDLDADPEPDSQTKQKTEDDAPLLPKVIAYDEFGVPINAQDVVTATPRESIEEYAWQDWFELEQVQRTYAKEMAKTAVVMACLGLYLKERVQLPFKLLRNKGKLQVLAEEDFQVGHLYIPLVVTHGSNLLDKSDHPHAVQVKHSITDNYGRSTEHEFFAIPEFALPKNQPAGKGHEWTGRNSVHFFWGTQAR